MNRNRINKLDPKPIAHGVDLVARDMELNPFMGLVWNRERRDFCAYRPDCPKQEYEFRLTRNGARELIWRMVQHLPSFKHWKIEDVDRYIDHMIAAPDSWADRLMDLVRRDNIVYLAKIDRRWGESKYFITILRMREEEPQEIPLGDAMNLNKDFLQFQGDGYNDERTC